MVNASHVHGPYFLGRGISFVDIQLAPWLIRLSRVLKPYRGWPDPEIGSRWEAWVNAMENDEHVLATTSSEDLYLDSYERYAGKFGLSPIDGLDFLTFVIENRPNTSQLAAAINAGRGLP